MTASPRRLAAGSSLMPYAKFLACVQVIRSHSRYASVSSTSACSPPSHVSLDKLRRQPLLARPRGSSQHVMLLRPDGGQRRPAAGQVARDRQPGSAAQRADQRRTLVEQARGAVGFEDHQLPHGRARGRRGQVRLRAAVPLQVLTWQVYPPVAQVLGHILPMLGQLQGSADAIGEGDAFRRGDAEEVEYDLANGVRGQLAVLRQVGERPVAGDLLVLPVGLDQVEERLGRHAALAHGVRHGAHDRRFRPVPFGTTLADTGLADTGLADTGLADTGLADTGLADTGLADTGLADTGAGVDAVD